MAVTTRQARARAIGLLLQGAQLERSRHVPFGLYGVDLAKDFLYSVHRPNRIGGTDYIAVSKRTGIARLAGTVGE